MGPNATPRLPRINLRISLVCAIGLFFGVYLWYRFRFGNFVPSDLLFLLLFLPLLLPPYGKKRLLSIVCALLLFGGIGAGVGALSVANYEKGAESGEYVVTGTVERFTVRRGYSEAVLGDLSLGGEHVGGKMRLGLSSEKVRAGDIVSFEGEVIKNDGTMSEGWLSEYYFYQDIRYVVKSAEYNKIASSSDLILRLRTSLYDTLQNNLGGTEAQVAFSVLTGDSGGMDEGLTEEVRRGGIAHIFAVSGLHVGILFSAVFALFAPLLRRYAYLPALGTALCYVAFCGFTVSSVRALVMCAALGLHRLVGRKYDFLNATSLALLLVLLIRPADVLSAGFRLSFGACVGLALFGGPLGRLFQKLRFPRFFARYLSANLSVQLFAFPVLLEAFGYFSVWGFVLNLLIVPVLPVFFLTVLLGAVFALAVPPAAGFFLALPEGLLSLFLLLFSSASFSFVLKGFSLGTGGAVLLVAFLLMSDRVRLKRVARAAALGGCAVLFALALVFENVVFAGGRGICYASGEGNAVLVQTRESAVLLIDGDITGGEIDDFLARTYGGTLDAVIVLSAEETDGLNHAAGTKASLLVARREVETGLRRAVFFGERYEIGGLVFRYESAEKMTLHAEGVVVEFDFEHAPSLGCDFSVDSASGGLKFFFEDGIIKTL